MKKSNARIQKTLHPDLDAYQETTKVKPKAHLVFMDRERLLPEYQPLFSPDPTSECILFEANGSLTDDTRHVNRVRGAFREPANVRCATNARIRASIGRSRDQRWGKRHGRAGGESGGG